MKEAQAESRAERVEAQLRESIFEGLYPPGVALKELALAKELQVSQATVREALQRLERSGLVERIPNIGTYVFRLGQRELREKVELRSALEVRAALEASANLTEEQFAKMEAYLQNAEAAAATGTAYGSAMADLSFHRFIWECSGNRTLQGVLEGLTMPLLAFYSLATRGSSAGGPTPNEAHQALAAALRSKEPSRIREAVKLAVEGRFQQFMEGAASAQKATAVGLMDVGR